MEEREKEVKILGAGLSGLTAGITLAREGYDVKIFEKNSGIGGRFNGDFEGIQNWTDERDILDIFQEMGLETDFYSKPFSELEVGDGREEWVEKGFEETLFYLVKRGNFEGSIDRSLKRQAEREGVEIIFGQERNEAEVDIVSTGPDPEHLFAAAKGIRFKTDMKDIAVGVVNDSMGYKGYAYLLVSDGKGCMCSVALGETERLEENFENARKLFQDRYDLEIEDPEQVGGVGNFQRNPKLEEENGKLFTGEAAGIQDFLWGFGMDKAIKSGYMAAKSIIEDKDYREMVGEEIIPQMRSSVVNRFMWEKMPERKVLRRLRDTEKGIGLLRKNYNHPVSHKISYPFISFMMKRNYPI